MLAEAVLSWNRFCDRTAHTVCGSNLASEPKATKFNEFSAYLLYEPLGNRAAATLIDKIVFSF